MMLLIAYLLYGLCSLSVPAFAATYYVATTGNDTTGDGTAGNRWATPQRCANAMVAGDTCIVGTGTYTDIDASGVTVSTSAAANGTAVNPIMLMSETPLGAIITVPSTSSLNAGFSLARDYWIVEGFEITGGTNTGSSASHHAFYHGGGTGNIIRANHMHTIGSGICSQSASGFTGVFLAAGTNLTIERNRIHTIGRLRDGEGGCSTALYQNDHALYLDNGSVTVRNNVIFDSNRGFPLQFFGGTISSAVVENNTFAGKSPTGSPAGQIMLGSTLTSATFRNNIFYDPPTAVFTTFSLTCTSITFDYGLTDSADANWFVATPPGCAADGGHNIRNTSPGFVDAGGNDYSLSAGSAARDAGTTIAGVPVDYAGTTRPQNGAFDIGAYEFIVDVGGGGGSLLRGAKGLGLF